MGKKFEQQPYNPLEADLLRETARVGRAPADAAPARPVAASAPAAVETVAELDPPSDAGRVVELPQREAPARRREPAPRPATSPAAEHPRPGAGRGAPEHATPAAAPKRSAQYIAKRFELTREEDLEFSAFLARVQKASGVRVPISVLIRALCTILQQGESVLAAELKRAQFRSLPSTGDTLGYAQFQDRWVELVRSAIKKTSRDAAQGLG